MSTLITRIFTLGRLPAAALLAMLTLAFAAGANAEAEQEGPNVRTAAIQVSAMIVDIDRETREVTLQTPHGDYVTLTASEDIQRFEEFEVGDSIVATYVTSLAGEVREPTEEERANPWQELDALAIADLDMPPGVAGGRVVKAVCTIEGMNRVAGTAMIEDPRGKFHLIGGIPRERFEGRMLGDTVVMIYSEALALTLEPAAME